MSTFVPYFADRRWTRLRMRSPFALRRHRPAGDARPLMAESIGWMRISASVRRQVAYREGLLPLQRIARMALRFT
jgi:hypothetical protein